MSESDQPRSQSLGDRGGFGVNVQLVVDRPNMIPNGIDTEAHRIGGRLVGMTVGEEFEEGNLLIGQRRRSGGGRGKFSKQAHDLRGSFRNRPTTFEAISGDIGAPPVEASRIWSSNRSKGVFLRR